MSDLLDLPVTSWDQPCSPAEQDRAIRALEGGAVIVLAQLPFVLEDGERRLLSPAVGGAGKNISLDATGEQVRGTSADATEHALLQNMMKRFAAASRGLIRNLLPRYEAGLQHARTSYRPIEIAGRTTSWRKDDTRLHVDSFPSSPLQGRRILRVFSNVNPDGKNRTWRLGEPFEDVSRRYLDSLRSPPWGASRALELLGITKGPRSAYDHFMLQLHDKMKADLAYQSAAAQTTYEFRPGSTWIVFTDQVSHAAMSGQYALEQTFHLPVASMLEPERSPLGTLERLLSRTLT